MIATKRILNIGCGEDLNGTDFIDLYPSRPEVIKCNVDKEKIPYKNNTFDEVYSKCLFEHLTNPLFALKEMHRVLKRGGKLVLITDNAACFYFHFKSLGKFYLEHYGGHEGKGPEDKHFALFTPEHLKNWMVKTGFKKIEINYHNPYSKRFITIFKKILQKISPKYFSLHLKVIAIK
jgi:ubiquinone/menaquinone biosynthesis C-methylase UbiE